MSIIRCLCAPNCGNFLGAGTASPRLGPFFALRTTQNWSTHHKKIVILTTWLIHRFIIPKLHLGLSFSLLAPARRPFPFPKVQLGNRKSSWCAAAPYWAYPIAEGGMRCAFPLRVHRLEACDTEDRKPETGNWLLATFGAWKAPYIFFEKKACARKLICYN